MSVAPDGSADFAGRAGVAFVSGGSGGIGAAICRLLAERGAEVVFTYRSNAGKAAALHLPAATRARAGVAVRGRWAGASSRPFSDGKACLLVSALPAIAIGHGLDRQPACLAERLDRIAYRDNARHLGTLGDAQAPLQTLLHAAV